MEVAPISPRTQYRIDSWNRIGDFIELSAKISEVVVSIIKGEPAPRTLNFSEGESYTIFDIDVTIPIEDINKALDEKLRECFLIFLEELKKQCTDRSFAQGRSCLEILINEEMRNKHKRPYDVVMLRSETSLEFHFRKDADFSTKRPQNFYPLFKGSFDELHEVQQGRYAITNPSLPKPVLGSWHFASCIGFAAFSSAKHIGILAHIDIQALELSVGNYKILGNLFSDIEKSFQNNGTDEVVEIEYILTGGCEEMLPRCFEDARDYVYACIEQSKLKNIKFKLLEEKGDKLSDADFKKDPAWTESLRLERSIALDTRKASLREALMSYEAELNPHSSLHKRDLTRAESDAIEAVIEKERNLLLSPVPPNEKN